MSNAVFPLGMNSMPSSGYAHKSTYYNRQYVSTKGTGTQSNPVGIATGHIRPLTNKDMGNVFQTGFGLARPIKHYRKGRVIPPNGLIKNNVTVNDPENSSNILNINENGLINYNTNRFVKSSKSTSLGGGFGGSGIINEIQDKPGSYTVKENTLDEVNELTQLNTDCKKCNGVGVVVNYFPNKTYLTENPEVNTTNQPTTYTSAQIQQMYSAVFGNYNLNPYYLPIYQNNIIKPGSPLSQNNTYLSNCQLNAQLFESGQNAIISKLLYIMLQNKIVTQTQVTNFYNTGINTVIGFLSWINLLPSNLKNQALYIFSYYINNPYWGMPASGPSNPAGCQTTIYKPNNYKYAKQGAVSSSTRMLKLTVNTISTNSASIQKNNNTGPLLVTANQIYSGDYPSINNSKSIYQNKAPNCNSPTIYPFQNKKICHYKKNLPSYQVPISQPSTYRKYIGTVFSSNHYSQSPNTYNTVTY